MILGPLEARDGGRTIALGGSRHRSVLALLLLDAGQVVSMDHIVHELWGESPPRTAVTAVQGYVSQLRKALGPGLDPSVIVTREPGYLIAIEPQQLDSLRFEHLRASAQEAMAHGDARAASTELERALGLWRGEPLADLRNERFAAEAARHLEETRVGAAEERIDAELALGRDRELVPELEKMIARDPLREHLREQLMLALYRSGRQADALRAYDDARRKLVGELGIEPGRSLRALQQRILEQDPGLEPPAASGTRTADRRRPTAPARAPVFAAGLFAIAAVALVVGLLLVGGKHRVSVTANSVAAISLATGKVYATFPVGGNPTSVAFGAGAVWALNADDQTVTRIDPRSHSERTLGTGGVPTDIAAGDGSLWVGNGMRTRAQFVGPIATTVSRLDPDSAAVLATVALPPAAGEVSNQSQYHIAVGPQGVWIVNPDFTVSRIDPATDRIAQHIRDVSAVAVATSAQGTWALESTGTIARLSAYSDRVAQRLRVPASSLSSIAVGAGAVWATDPNQGTLWRIDPTPQPIERTIPLANGVNDLAYGAGALWVANGLSGTVSRVDPHSNRVTKTIAFGNTPGRLAVGGGSVWVAIAGNPAISVPPASQGDAGIAALPASVCGRVFFDGKERPQRLIVSDLPLRGAPRLPTQQMSAAIAYVLREHDFRAGRFRIGYQSCDDSTAQTGIFDDRKCIANAKAWDGNPLVAGVIGPYNSGCALDEIPITNRAGPLAMVSPTNSDPGLTHAASLSPPGLLGRLYPTGVRNYVRLYPSDELQGEAMAEFARRRGISGVYVLDDGGYGATMAAGFRLAAKPLHVRLAGSSSWEPSARSYRPLAERVARSGATAVYVSGLIDTNGGAVIRALRERFGRRIVILANDGFLPIGELFQTVGAGAVGVFVSTAPLPNGQLGLRGREFVTRFTATQHQARVDPATVYAAQATELMLEAIGQSNGTRSSVARALLAACVHDGILGSFCFDRNGDPTSTSVTIVRTERAGGAATVGSTDGSVVAAVIEPPRLGSRAG